MRYRLEIGDEARGQLRTLQEAQRRLIGQRLEALQTGLLGNVKKLEGKEGRYRLRVGDHRVLFVLEKDLILVYRLKDRKDSYRR
jgi:mRNA-degrading endonuclease RelE of RelBE toxin-antitoxin system